MNKNIGLITLCGLIIGPILGSGIVLLPPIAYSNIGDFAILAWIIIMLLGIVFAYVFTFLSLESPGNEGVAIAVGNTLGLFFRDLCSNFLTTAVCFGPVAVLITASTFLKNIYFLKNVNLEWIALALIIICILVLIRGVKSIGKFNLIFTGFTAVILFFGSAYTLFFSSRFHPLQSTFSFSKFGYTLLLLFWAIVGWEVVGNYIEDIKNPKKTLMKAMTISLIVITLLYLIVALSLQTFDGNTYDIISIMTPLLGSFAIPVIGIMASGLCISTYLMIVGGVTRMSAKRSENNKLPSYLSKVNKHGSPVYAIITLSCIHLFMLILVSYHVLNLDSLVSCANVFFLSNAIIGLSAGFKLLQNIKLKISILILITSFTLLILKADIWSKFLLIIVFLLSLYLNKKATVMKD
ncbi:MAG TPA: amino acid permease [Clostridium sp.]